VVDFTNPILRFATLKVAIQDGRIDVAIDWKSDVNPTADLRAAYGGQLRDYLEATGAPSVAPLSFSLLVKWPGSIALPDRTR